MFDIPHDQLARTKQLEEMHERRRPIYREGNIGYYGFTTIGFRPYDRYTIIKIKERTFYTKDKDKNIIKGASR